MKAISEFRRYVKLSHEPIRNKNLLSYLFAFNKKGKPGFDYTIRTEFKKNAVALERTDVLMIEHLMRNGKRKLEMIQDPNVSGMGQFVKDKNE